MTTRRWQPTRHWTSKSILLAVGSISMKKDEGKNVIIVVFPLWVITRVLALTFSACDLSTALLNWHASSGHETRRHKKTHLYFASTPKVKIIPARKMLWRFSLGTAISNIPPAPARFLQAHLCSSSMYLAMLYTSGFQRRRNRHPGAILCVVGAILWFARFGRRFQFPGGDFCRLKHTQMLNWFQ